MVDTTIHRDHQATRSTYVVQRMTEPDEISALLTPERAYAAYALAQLEPGLFELTDWYTAMGPGSRALVVHSRGGLGRALFTMGDPLALHAVLSLHPGPRFTFGSLRPEHRPAVERYFILTRGVPMLRMSVTPDAFAPATGEAVRLRGSDIARINRLYSYEGGATTYSPRHIEDGVYYGVLEDGTLASIAGTHALSPAEGLAVVGNVFTHPRFRGRGLATIATGAVTQALLPECPLVTLTVEAENSPAVRVYRRLGYGPECTLHETPLIRKEPLGVASLTRRLIAGWRGRREGIEMVVR
ncbi:MAG: GNAT family N-acetyltransferase [Dehalococcoidia bacterium]